MQTTALSVLPATRIPSTCADVNVMGYSACECVTKPLCRHMACSNFWRSRRRRKLTVLCDVINAALPLRGRIKCWTLSVCPFCASDLLKRGKP